MPSQLLSQDFESRVFEIIESTSFKELLNSNRDNEKKIIAEYYEKIEIYHLAIEVYLSLMDYNSVKDYSQKANQKLVRSLKDMFGNVKFLENKILILSLFKKIFFSQ